MTLFRRDDTRSPQVEEAHRETDRIIERLRPHVLNLAVHVEALEKAVDAEREVDRGRRP